MIFDIAMRSLRIALVLSTFWVITGCHSVSHENHGEETHLKTPNNTSQADDTEEQAVYWWGKIPPP